MLNQLAWVCVVSSGRSKGKQEVFISSKLPQSLCPSQGVLEAQECVLTVQVDTSVATLTAYLPTQGVPLQVSSGKRGKEGSHSHSGTPQSLCLSDSLSFTHTHTHLYTSLSILGCTLLGPLVELPHLVHPTQIPQRSVSPATVAAGHCERTQGWKVRHPQGEERQDKHPVSSFQSPVRQILVRSSIIPCNSEKFPPICVLFLQFLVCLGISIST